MNQELRPTFIEVFCEHKNNIADKWEAYLPVYDELFSRYRRRCERFLEIGINAGGSLEVYAKYFYNAKVIAGIDINSNCAQIKFNDPRIALFIGDATQENARQALQESIRLFDIILDDGSHQSDDIIKTFINLISLLAPGGVYIIEDLHCSYWREFKGGIWSETSAIAFFKKLVDVINHEHWNSGYTIAEFLFDFGISDISQAAISRIGTIRSIEFVNSICIIKCADFSHERLVGRRVCRGSIASAGYVPTNGIEIKDVGLGSDQTSNPLNKSRRTSL